MPKPSTPQPPPPKQSSSSTVEEVRINDTLPRPSPPRPPLPKQAPEALKRDMEQAMASARAKNAAEDTGWASNLVEAAVRAMMQSKR
eukprot:4418094-Amphidinium_carterae.3